MERFGSMQVLCAALPERRQELEGLPVVPAWMCYQMGSGPNLYRSAPPESINGGVLMVSDGGMRGGGGSPSRFCQQALRECAARNAVGLCANWSARLTESMRQLTSALDSAFAGKNLTLWVPEAYGDVCRSAQVLISSAMSGGTLRQRLEEAVERYGAERTALAVEWMRSDFLLSSEGAAERELSEAELDALREKYAPKIYQTSELAAEYFTYSEDEHTHLVLFDTPESLRNKLELAQSMGIASVMTAWDEVGQWLREWRVRR